MPPEYADDPAGYVDLVTGPMLDAAAPHARWIDVFCETGAFDADQARTILAGRCTRRGSQGRLHANQLGPVPAYSSPASSASTAVDHCTYLDDADVAALADSGTIATLLPGVEFSTRSPYPDARGLVDAGVTVALASDCNPGSCYTSSMPLCVALAVREMRMTPAEALWSATAGGARALGRDDVGALAPGQARPPHRAGGAVVPAPRLPARRPAGRRGPGVGACVGLVSARSRTGPGPLRPCPADETGGTMPTRPSSAQRGPSPHSSKISGGTHMRSTRIFSAVLVVGALALSGCGSDSLDNGSKSSASKADTTVDKAAAAMVPKAIADKGTLTVGTDATYAPERVPGRRRQDHPGLRHRPVHRRGQQARPQGRVRAAKFDSIITGVQGSKYDVGVSSFTVNADREKQATMVSYFNAGTQWATAKGNPKNVDPDKPCGLTVAVQKGTVQQEEDLPPKEAACKKAGKPVKVLVYEGQDAATAAVVSNKADAMLADSPVVAYAVEQSKGKLEPAGDIYDAAPYGYVLPKDGTKLGDAIVAALKSLESDGGYEKALKGWGVEAGAINDFAVNPAV